MILALALALVAIAGGALVTYLFDEDAPPLSRLCMGACIGFAALGLFGFVLASLLGFTSTALVLTAALLASPLLLLLKPERRIRVRADVHDSVRGARRGLLHPTGQGIAHLIFYALVLVLLWLVFDRAMVEQAD
ncbi:MAG TPA: hypothetical protein VJT09_01045, partial [Pyrinomonadaceae bacterium]|nr:hypothetical protein [Pyrinomonadaceae bacterium]